MMSKKGTATDTAQLRPMPITLVTPHATLLLFCSPASSLQACCWLFNFWDQKYVKTQALSSAAPPRG